VKTDVKISGAIELSAMLNEFKPAVQRRILRGAVMKAGRPMARTAKSNLAGVRRSGLLAKSIGIKNATLKSGAVIAILGPRRKMGGVYTPKGSTKSRKVLPTLYAHLVEYGTKRSRAHPFMRPAYNAHRASARSTLETAIAEGIQREAAKLARKAKK